MSLTRDMSRMAAAAVLVVVIIAASVRIGAQASSDELTSARDEASDLAADLAAARQETRAAEAEASDASAQAADIRGDMESLAAELADAHDRLDACDDLQASVISYQVWVSGFMDWTSAMYEWTISGSLVGGQSLVDEGDRLIAEQETVQTELLAAMSACYDTDGAVT